MQIAYFPVLQAEWLKRRRTAANWLVILGALFIPAINFLGAYLDAPAFAEQVASERFWQIQFMNAWKPMAIFLLPLGVILAASLVTQIEFRNNGWKQVHASPVPFAKVYLAKFAVLMGMVLQFFLLFNLGFIVAGIFPVLFSAKLSLVQDSFPMVAYLEGNLKFLLAVMPVITLQFVLGLRLRNMMIPLGIGIVLFVSTLFAVSLKYNYLFPYDYCTLQYFLYADPKFPQPPIPLSALGAMVSALILVAGYFVLRLQKEKG